MNARSRGTRRRIPSYRRTVLDLVRESQRVPSFPLHRTMQLACIDDARQKSTLRVGWTALFARAYALVCQHVPELREVYVRYPAAHLYRHPSSVASISIHRADESGNERLIWGRICEAEHQSVDAVQQSISSFVNDPLHIVYREGMILERQPAILRRCAWWMLMNWSGRKRAKHIGTFSISSLGGFGVLNSFHPLVTTSSLAFGPVSSNGDCDVVLLCDHRVLDGVLGSQALLKLETILNSTLCQELSDVSRGQGLAA